MRSFTSFDKQAENPCRFTDRRDDVIGDHNILLSVHTVYRGMSSYCSVLIVLMSFRALSFRHLAAKWFSPQQTLHFRPQAGHLPLSCGFPQNEQFTTKPVVTRVASLGLRSASLPRFPHSLFLVPFLIACMPMSPMEFHAFACSAFISELLMISNVFSNVKSHCSSNLSLTLSFRTFDTR